MVKLKARSQRSATAIAYNTEYKPRGDDVNDLLQAYRNTQRSTRVHKAIYSNIIGRLEIDVTTVHMTDMKAEYDTLMAAQDTSDEMVQLRVAYILAIRQHIETRAGHALTTDAAIHMQLVLVEDAMADHIHAAWTAWADHDRTAAEGDAAADGDAFVQLCATYVKAGIAIPVWTERQIDAIRNPSPSTPKPSIRDRHRLSSARARADSVVELSDALRLHMMKLVQLYIDPRKADFAAIAAQLAEHGAMGYTEARIAAEYVTVDAPVGALDEDTYTESYNTFKDKLDMTVKTAYELAGQGHLAGYFLTKEVKAHLLLYNDGIDRLDTGTDTEVHYYIPTAAAQQDGITDALTESYQKASGIPDLLTYTAMLNRMEAQVPYLVKTRRRTALLRSTVLMSVIFHNRALRGYAEEYKTSTEHAGYRNDMMMAIHGSMESTARLADAAIVYSTAHQYFLRNAQVLSTRVADIGKWKSVWYEPGSKPRMAESLQMLLCGQKPDIPDDRTSRRYARYKTLCEALGLSESDDLVAVTNVLPMPDTTWEYVNAAIETTMAYHMLTPANKKPVRKPRTPIAKKIVFTSARGRTSSTPPRTPGLEERYQAVVRDMRAGGLNIPVTLGKAYTAYRTRSTRGTITALNDALVSAQAMLGSAASVVSSPWGKPPV